MKTADLRKKLTGSKILAISLIFLICGAGVASVWGAPKWMWLVAAAALFPIAINHKDKLMAGLFFCLLAFWFGVWKAESELAKMVDRDLGQYVGLTEVVRGSEQKQNYQRVVVRPVEAGYGNRKFVIYADHHPEFSIGEMLEISCDLKKPENKHVKFNYVKYLAKDGIYQICSGAKISRMGRTDSFFSFGALSKVKKSLDQKISLLFPDPESGYLSGLLLGGSDQLGVEVSEQFRRTGTTHTVAVSGYNITILANLLILLGIIAGLWRQQAFWLSTVGIIFFVLMIGSPASAVRAAVMGILVLWAAKRGRLANSMNAIIFTAALMVWFSPLILVYDVGFQLSFLATIGIVTVYGPLAERFNIKNDFLGLKSILLVTVAAQLGVLGILIYTFESISPISLLANLVILPIIPLIMLGGFSVVIASFIFPILAKMFAVAVWAALHFELKSIELLSNIPWALIEIKNISFWWLAGYYVFFVLLVLQLKNWRKTVQ